jgi:hypothetical protein
MFHKIKVVTSAPLPNQQGVGYYNNCRIMSCRLMMLHAKGCDIATLVSAYEGQHLGADIEEGSPNVPITGEVSLETFQCVMDKLAASIRNIEGIDSQLTVDSIVLDLTDLKAALLPAPQQRLAELRVCFKLHLRVVLIHGTSFSQLEAAADSACRINYPSLHIAC